VCPAHEPAYEAVERLAEELEHSRGLLQLASDLGTWPARGWPSGPRRVCPSWPAHGRKGGALFTKNGFTLDFARGTVTCPNGQTTGCVDDASGVGSGPLSGHQPPGMIARAAMALRSTRLVLRGFALTLQGDVMTGTELERDVLARLDRLPNGLPFG
jgi:hypothetical protein